MAGGAAQPNMSGTQIENIPILMPINDVLIKYEQLVLPTLNKIIQLHKMNQAIIKIRDLLIPQLVTGKRELKF